MKKVITVIAVGVGTASATFAGDLFLQFRVEKTRCGVPCKNHYSNSQPKETTTVLSEPAISVGTGRKQRLTFVFDDANAGPVTLTDLRASTDGNGVVRVTGVLKHSGGDTGLLLGGKAVIRVEPLAHASNRTGSGTSLGTEESEYWVKRNEPQSVHLNVQYNTNSPGVIGDVQRVRLFLEYHQNR